MKIKELKIQVPKGYEIDKENSTFECIKFKPIKKDITYQNVGEKIFSNNVFYINYKGEIDYYNQKEYPKDYNCHYYDKNNATNKKQLKRILALNQLLNIAKYYNQLHTKEDYKQYYIVYHMTIGYKVYCYDENAVPSVVVTFNRKEDAQAVINNPNFQEILNTIYKD